MQALKILSETFMHICLGIALLATAWALLSIAFLLDPGNKYNKKDCNPQPPIVRAK